MYIKISESGGRSYARLVEAYREDGKVKQRVIVNLGRVDALQSADNALANGFRRLLGVEESKTSDGALVFAPSLSVGATWLLHSLWKQLGLSDVFRPVLERLHPGFDADALLRIMVFNRLCDPESKLGILRWLEGTLVPGVPVDEVTHQRLLRTMDSLAECRDDLEERLAKQLRPLLDDELAIVFYDLTTLRAEGSAEVVDDLRGYGMSKEGIIAQQCLLGVVQTAEGLPIYHEVFSGNTAETVTLLPTFRKLLERYRIRRIILVADRGLLSLDNLQDLLEVRLPDGSPMEFILGVPGRRYTDFIDLLEPFQQSHCEHAVTEVFGELAWQGQRLIVAHHPEQARTSRAKRDDQIKALCQQGEAWAGKLDGQDAGKKHRGRKLSDGGAMARFHAAIRDARLSKIIRLDLSSPQFRYEIDEKAQTHARLMDGKLLLITNVKDLQPQEVVARYKSLADIERGFRVLKSEIDIVPMYHRLPDRIRAHAMICFLALLMHRVLRMRLRSKQSQLSPERALEITGKIQWHQATDSSGTRTGITRLDSQQRDLFETIDLPMPEENAVKMSV